MIERFKRLGLLSVAMSLAMTFLGWSCAGERPPPSTDAGTDAASPADGSNDVASDDSETQAGNDSSADSDDAGTTSLDAGADGGTDGAQEAASSDSGEDSASDALAVADVDSATPADATSETADAASSLLIDWGQPSSFLNGPCLTAPPPISLTITNVGALPVTWTSSVTATSSNAFTPPSLAPATSTLAPSQSVGVTVSFAAQTSPSVSTVEITISDGHTNQTMSWSVDTNGYTAATPANINFGNVQVSQTPTVTQTVTVVAEGEDNGTTPNGSPCELFNAVVSSQSASPLLRGGGFSIQSCSAQNAPGALVTIAFTPGQNAAAGVYSATFTFAMALGGPACNSPAPFTATATVLPPTGTGTP